MNREASSRESRWTLRLLGDPALIAADASVRALERCAAALFALVALEPGITRQRLASLLWPDADESGARHALRQQLLRLKKLAGRELLSGTAALTLAEDLRIDVGNHAAGGQLLGNYAFDDCEELALWVERERARRRELIATDLERHLAAAEASGDLEAALRFAEQRLQADTTSEAHARDLMRLHYLRGDRAAALAAYERCRALLAREFGVAPSAEIETLKRQIEGAVLARPLPSAVPVTVLRPPRLIGRRRELQALAGALAGEDHAVVLGEAGMGKTRLLTELCSQRSDVVLVQARPADAQLPFAVLARLFGALRRRGVAPADEDQRAELARISAEFGTPAKTPADALTLEGAVERFLVSARAGGVAVCAIDDLHLADDASVEMLTRLALSEGVPRLACGCRPAEGGHPLAVLRAGLGEAHRWVEITLAPLAAGEIEDLVASLGIAELDAHALAAPLAKHTGGNPQFVLETLKAILLEGAAGAFAQGRLPLPAGVGALIERRLRRLSAEALQLARVAAVAGVDFSIELAEAVVDKPPLALADAWAELQAANVLSDAAFAHDLVFEATLRGIPAPVAARVHGQVAAYLESRLESRGAEPARVAEHWLAAHQDERAVVSLHAAANAAETALRFPEAVRFLLRAADIEQASGRRTAAFRSVTAALESITSARRNDLADLLCARLEELADTPWEVAEANCRRADNAGERGEYDKAIAAAESALRLATRENDADHMLKAHNALGANYAMLGDTDAALQHLQAVLPSVDRLTEPERATVFGNYALALDNADRQAEAGPFHERMLEICWRQKNFRFLVAALGNLAINLSDTGRFAAALYRLLEAQRLCAAHEGLAGGGLTVSSHLALVTRQLGRYAEALRWAEITIGAMQSHAPAWLPLAQTHLAGLWLVLGQFARARQELERAKQSQQAPDWVRSLISQHEGRLALALGRPALEPFARARELLPRHGLYVQRATLELDCALTLEPHPALELAAHLAEEAQARGHLGVALAAHTRAARFATTIDPACAVQHADCALDHVARGVTLNSQYHGEVDLAAWSALRAVDDPRGADVLRAAVNRIRRTAVEQVPAEFRESFLTRNAINRELLTAATRPYLKAASATPPGP